MKNRRGGGGGTARAQGLTFQREPIASQNVLSCPGCDFSCATIMNLRHHLQETNHDQPPGAKIESESPKTGGPPADEGDDTAGIIPDHIKQVVFILKDYMQLSEREPIVGLEYVLEYRIQPSPDQPKRLRYFCQLCEADCDLVGMMEHLSCYRHRKLYLMKEFPYVLRAPSNARENRAQFMRRMAMEIEKEEAKKTYKMDTTLRTEPMKSAEGKQTRIKTRWNYEGDQQKRMRKAVEYLEKFEIDNDTEAATVTRLTEKLIAELKYHSDKLKEEALFPAKVARAKDVAMSIMQNTPRKPMPPKKDNPVLNPPPPAFTNPPPPAFTNPPPPAFTNPPPPVFNAPPPFNMPPPPVFNAGPPPPFNMPPPPLFNNPPPENNTNSVPPQPNPSWTPNTAFPAVAQNAENVPQIAQPNPGAQSEQPSEDNKFVKKLKLLLSVLQHNSTSADGGQVSSKFLMLKSLLQNKGGNTQTNQLPMQMGSMTPDMAGGADNMALYQQLQLMASTNPAAMAQFAPNIMMQMASMTNSVVPMDNAQVGQHSMMQMAVQFQNSQMNANSFMPENREFVSEYGNMNQMIQNQYVDQQQQFSNTFQTNEGFGYDGQMPGNNAMRPVEEAPYTRVSLSPSNQRRERERFHDDGGYERDLRRDVRPLETRTSYGERRLLDEPPWEERDSGMHYGKRARQDSDRMSSHSAERGRHYPDEGDAMGSNTPNLSVDLLKRIRGKDLFTVSAILSEYAENPSSR